MKPITILLADDHTVVREGLRALLQAEGDMEIIAEAETGRKAVELARQLHPTVVVMDIAMPLLNGLEATRQIFKTAPGVKVLILSAYNDDEYIRQVVAVGASGYLLKQTSLQILAHAIREIEKGHTFFSPVIAKRLEQQEGPISGKADDNQSNRLSSREIEVLQLIAEGKANKETAAELCISIKTVEKHRQKLMNKLALHDTASLTRYAISTGLIENRIQLTII